MGLSEQKIFNLQMCKFADVNMDEEQIIFSENEHLQICTSTH